MKITTTRATEDCLQIGLRTSVTASTEQEPHIYRQGHGIGRRVSAPSRLEGGDASPAESREEHAGMSVKAAGACANGSDNVAAASAIAEEVQTMAPSAKRKVHTQGRMVSSGTMAATLHHALH